MTSEKNTAALIPVALPTRKLEETSAADPLSNVKYVFSILVARNSFNLIRLTSD